MPNRELPSLPMSYWGDGPPLTAEHREGVLKAISLSDAAEEDATVAHRLQTDTSRKGVRLRHQPRSIC